jgi:hypothetical protein
MSPLKIPIATLAIGRGRRRGEEEEEKEQHCCP